MNDFSYSVCPDGKVKLDAGEIYGTWDLPNGVEIAPWPYSDYPISWPAMPTGNNEKMFRNLVVRFPSSGDYEVSFTGYAYSDWWGYGSSSCRCTKTKTIHVELNCCAKNDGKRGRYYFTEGGNDYRMEFNFLQRQFPIHYFWLIPSYDFVISNHTIIGSTYLDIKKMSRGHSHWKKGKSDEIEASFDGEIYSRNFAGCNCKDEKNARDTKLRYNRSKARFVFHTQGSFRSKFESLYSNHRIRLGSREIEFHWKLGIDCDSFHWWSDWY
jgi:hypothetical protein